MIRIDPASPLDPDVTRLIFASHALMDELFPAERKSVFVDPEARGSGAAQASMRMLEDHARKRKLPLLRLETGDRLHAARKLYANMGFEERGPYGDYVLDPLSVYMEKRLAPAETRDPATEA